MPLLRPRSPIVAPFKRRLANHLELRKSTVWDSVDNEWVAFKAPSLISSEQPPYPGFAVRTRSEYGSDGPQTVMVEVWSKQTPPGLNVIHRSTLAIGGHGLVIGNEDSRLEYLDLPRGCLPILIAVDATRPDQVARVVFVLEPVDA